MGLRLSFDSRELQGLQRVTSGRRAPRLLHIITNLNVGGAENMLAKLLEHQSDAPQQHVISLMPPSAMGPRIRQLGVPIHTLSMHQGIPSVSAIGRLVRLIRFLSPDLIMGWMHHGYVAASLGSALGRWPHPPIVWNVRHSLNNIRHEKPLTRVILRLAALASRSAAAIVYNSSVAEGQYQSLGFDGSKSLVIPNGFDCERFRPRADARLRLKTLFGIDDTAVVVGMVARYHPMKDPTTLIEAISCARQNGLDLHLLLVGSGMDNLPATVRSAITRSIPAGRFSLSDHRSDVDQWLPGLDILALPSAWGEGFPNVLGEAMSCGVPCIATDVGDSRWILGDAGRTVPPRDFEEMAIALSEFARIGAAGRRVIGAQGRARIIENFSISKVAQMYSHLYQKVIHGHSANEVRQAMMEPNVPR